MKKNKCLLPKFSRFLLMFLKCLFFGGGGGGGGGGVQRSSMCGTGLNCGLEMLSILQSFKFSQRQKLNNSSMTSVSQVTG